jgi:hypothetical protein
LVGLVALAALLEEELEDRVLALHKFRSHPKKKMHLNASLP